MTHTPAKVIRQLLVDLGLSVDPHYTNGVYDGGDWPAFSSNEPDFPDNCLTVYDTQGTDDGRIMHDGELRYHFGIQLRVRAKDEPTGWTKLDGMRHSLSQVGNAGVGATVTVGASVYRVTCLTRFGQVIPLGRDVSTSKRSLFTLNCTVPMRQLA